MKLTIAFGDYYEMAVRVRSLREASMCFAAYRDAFGFGASNMREGCGDVRQGRRLVGRISYNGRIWDPKGRPLSV
jgi:hypothetical protein